MRKQILLGGSVLVAVAFAAPAVADPVTITNDGGCRHVYVGSKQVTPPNGFCYLGPPGPSR